MPAKPRVYRLGQRRLTIEETRARIISAARELLAAPDGFAGFTIDAVAARAGVARMTLYNQFGCKRGLLEALFDDLAVRGLVGPLRACFTKPEPREALDALIAAFANLWNSERLIIRRIRALASLDADFEQAVAARDERRRGALRTLVSGIADVYHKPSPTSREDVTAVLHALTSFEVFDSLVGPRRKADRVVILLCQIARALIESSAP